MELLLTQGPISCGLALKQGTSRVYHGVWHGSSTEYNTGAHTAVAALGKALGTALGTALGSTGYSTTDSTTDRCKRWEADLAVKCADGYKVGQGKCFVASCAPGYELKFVN